MEISPHSFTLPFVKKESVAKDTYAFYFDRTKESWEFHPGQYIRMILPQDNPDDRGTMRYFSISSSPNDKQYLRVVTKVIQSTFKHTLDSLQPGKEVSFFGPNGSFYLREEETVGHVFLAGGIGMTPFLSMTAYAAEKQIKTPIYLFVSFPTVEEIIFYDHLQKLSVDHPNIHVIYTLTKPEQSEKPWNGETGRISEALLKKYLVDLSTPLYYIVGPPPMVEASAKMLGDLGITEDRILQEHFSGY